jgi:nucleotide-binding universal stress UspA family protein
MSFVASVFHPTDFSEAGEHALMHALAVAVQCRAELTILPAFDEAGARDDFEEFPAVRRTLERWGHLKASSARSAVFDQLGVRVQNISPRAHSPVDAADDYLHEHRTDLVVLATEGRSGIPAWFKPSAAEYLARETRSMTLFVREGVSGFVSPDTGAVALSRILVPVARDPAPQPAVDCAASLARLTQAPVELVLFHVGDGGMPQVSKPGDPRLVFRNEVGHGDVIDEIVRAARDLEADVVVMTTDGRDGFLGAMGRGSHTERVVRQAACPVLAVPVQRIAATPTS